MSQEGTGPTTARGSLTGPRERESPWYAGHNDSEQKGVGFAV